MPRFAVDYSGWLYVDADNADDAFADACNHLTRLLEDFEIVNVEEADND